jgi:2-methylcitrate dehydratase PrpD
VSGASTDAARRLAGLDDAPADRIIRAGVAGHVLDYDDTYEPGLTHVSAAIAPAVLVLGAQLDVTVGDGLRAFARAWEALAAFTAAAHPALYERGWHPTAVAGVVGAAVAAGRLLGLDADREQAAVGLALLSSSGLRAAFGSDGKAIQVALAAAHGATAARLAAAGASVNRAVVDGPAGFRDAYGAPVVLRGDAPAIGDNWIKAYPCCLQTHSAIETALAARAAGAEIAGATVAVHPISLLAASRMDVATGLEAKFSIPYTTALAFLEGAPRVESFRDARPHVRELAATITVAPSGLLAQSAAKLTTRDGSGYVVEAATGSPANPMTPDAHARKLHDLAGDRIGLVHDEDAMLADLAAAAGL